MPRLASVNSNVSIKVRRAKALGEVATAAIVFCYGIATHYLSRPQSGKTEQRCVGCGRPARAKCRMKKVILKEI